MDKYIIIALIIWNIIVFLLYGLDKKRAIKDRQRISEKTLLLSAFIMGGVGAFLGMKHFRHKTKHTNFKILIPFSIILNILILYGYSVFSKGII